MRLVTNAETSGLLVRRCGSAALLVLFLIGWLRIQAVQREWCSVELAVVLVALANALTFLLLVWIGARSVLAAERQKARAQREVQERFQEVADAMPQIVWAARPDGMLDYTNRRWYEFIQKTEAEVSPADWGNVFTRTI